MKLTEELGKIDELLEEFIKSDGICIDSRTIKNNQIFFAFHGQNTDGSKYVDSALQNGAVLAIVKGDPNQDTSKIIHVNNVLLTLQLLAKKYRQLFDIPVLGLTGSNGKTTTKELLYNVLSEKYITHCTHGNFNNHIGVPLTILSMPMNTEFAIIEMGANHQHEIQTLCDIAQPNYGFITNIGNAHLEGFGSIEGVLNAKLELFDYLKIKEGTVLLNTEDRLLNKSKGTYKGSILLNDNKLDYWEVVSVKNEPCLNLVINTLDGVLECPTTLIGEYNVQNIKASIFIGLYFGVQVQSSIKAITLYNSSNNRSSLLKVDEHQFIMDAYNANPSSMKVAIENFVNLKVKNKILIIGDMLELGNSSLVMHQEVVDIVAKYNWYHVFLVGEEFLKCQSSEMFTAKNVEEAIDLFNELDLQPSWILLKGSRGIQLERLVKQIQ